MLRTLLLMIRNLGVKLAYTGTYWSKNNSRYSFGKYTYGVPIIFDALKKYHLTIGNFTSISGDVIIFLDGNHRTDWISMYPPRGFSISHGKYLKTTNGHPASKGNVYIGNDVWIGYGAKIMSGVTIGDGAVIGAETVVTHNVPPYAVVAGAPGRIFKYRFTKNIIKKLLKIKWWNWTHEKIEKNINLLLSPNVNTFIKRFLAE